MIGSLKKPRSSDAKIEAPADTDDFVPDYTRTSDTKKKYAQHRSSQSGFGSKKTVAEAGVITRTSDRKSLYKKAPEGPREKPAHSSKPYAVWLLSRRDYSAGILRNKLVLRGYDADEANVAMSFVIANGYQNDERYAESLARTLSRRAGNSRLLMTMSQKKIDPATAVLKLGTLEPVSERVIDEFIPIAGETGLIAEISEWIFEEAGRQATIWRALTGSNFQISVNLSAVQLRESSYTAGREAAVLHAALVGLVLEVSGAILTQAYSEQSQLIQKLVDSGAQFAIDDFGVGPATLAHLKHFRLAYLKIAQPLVARLAHESNARAMCARRSSPWPPSWTSPWWRRVSRPKGTHAADVGGVCTGPGVPLRGADDGGAARDASAQSGLLKKPNIN